MLHFLSHIAVHFFTRLFSVYIAILLFMCILATVTLHCGLHIYVSVFITSHFYVVQVIVKDSSIVLTLAHIKAYMLQTFLGLEYLHAHWILHRVRRISLFT